MDPERGKRSPPSMGKGSEVKSQYLDTSDKHNSFAKVKVNYLVPSALWSMAKGLGSVIMLNGQIGYQTHDVILACVAHNIASSSTFR